MNADSISAPEGATTFTNNDAAIIAAWDRMIAAYATYDNLAEHTGEGAYSAEEQAQWDIIDAAELVIYNAVASTPRGAELQLWAAVNNTLTERDACAAALRQDLAWFDANGEGLDWTERNLISVLRSLRAIGGAA